MIYVQAFLKGLVDSPRVFFAPVIFVVAAAARVAGQMGQLYSHVRVVLPHITTMID